MLHTVLSTDSAREHCVSMKRARWRRLPKQDQKISKTLNKRGV